MIARFPTAARAWVVGAIAGLTSIANTATTAPSAPAPDFLREVRPILSAHCFKCHGPDDAARKGGLRLDRRDAALRPAKSGEIAISPGQPEKSAIIARIFSKDDDELMPPPSVKHPLDARQKELLRRWVEAGAEYQPHWAFAPIRSVQPPRIGGLDIEPPNPIDAFIIARLNEEGLEPSPEADRLALARRVSLDLIGLPPTPEEADAFASDHRPDAYERLVDRLLASPRYGERWARKWLDLARYADSNGYEKDRERSIWPYRDWVIRALNADMPFDQFTVEQLAGDMLPGSTRDQKVATGFHRNTMLNEEGGIDPLEFRFHAVVDRVNTTGTAWLGLTVGCAQCHTHKYDPIQHQEYYQFMAFLNNADEPELDLPSADDLEKARARTTRAAKLLTELPSHWPADPGPLLWHRATLAIDRLPTNDTARVLDDGSVLFTAPGPDRSDVTVSFSTPPALTNITHLRLEALTHESLPKSGPGRAPHGNFVLSEISASRTADGAGTGKATKLKIRSATATTEQEGFPVTHAMDGREDTGWAVHQAGRELNTNHSATFALEGPAERTDARPDGPWLWSVRLRMAHGGRHTLGRLALSVGMPAAVDDAKSALVKREESMEAAFASWRRLERERAVEWTPLRPASLRANLPRLTVLPDFSVLASGDISKSDVYDLVFTNLPARVTAIRLEALPDDSLPAHGPGLTYYEGPKGDFFLGEFQVTAGGRPVKFARATETHAKNNFGGGASAKAATDGDPQTGWSCADRPGEAHQAVFVPTEPIVTDRLEVRMLFGRHYACSLGRFRLSFTTDPRGAEARDVPESIDALLRLPEDRLTEGDRALLREHFLLTAPGLAAPAKEIGDLLKPPVFRTTLMLRERPAGATRPTFVHQRGEFLQPTDPVEPGVPQFLPALPDDAPRNRLTFARWLVSPENPLTPRVVVNRQWSAFFGHGIVGTENDFGFQGELPTHPAMLDWLALKFIEDGWSLKKLHRRIVTSSTYRQASRRTPALAMRDPNNRLLARGPRVRLEAELIRDAALAASGLMSDRMFGPPVRPPQPAGVTEVAYGSPRWELSPGEDRHRRSIYTFQKRSAPFAMFNTFDAPSGETCVARREVSNTPLQSLTLLNDIALVEAARNLGALAAAQPGDDQSRIRFVFRRVLTRSPDAAEQDRLGSFLEKQRGRLQRGELNAADLAGEREPTDNVMARAAWTTVARAVLNLDEGITKQ